MLYLAGLPLGFGGIVLASFINVQLNPHMFEMSPEEAQQHLILWGPPAHHLGGGGGVYREGTQQHLYPGGEGDTGYTGAPKIVRGHISSSSSNLLRGHISGIEGTPLLRGHISSFLRGHLYWGGTFLAIIKGAH